MQYLVLCKHMGGMRNGMSLLRMHWWQTSADHGALKSSLASQLSSALRQGLLRLQAKLHLVLYQTLDVYDGAAEN